MSLRLWTSRDQRPLVDAPPGPRQLPLLGSALDIQRDRLGFLRTAASYGDLSLFRIASKPIYLASGRAAALRVLVHNAGNYRKGIGLTEARFLLGNGLLTSSGEAWRLRRAALRPIFSQGMSEAVAAAISKEAAILEREWARAAHEKRVVRLDEELTHLSLRVNAAVLFGPELSDAVAEVGPALAISMSEAMRRMTTPFAVPLAVPTRANRQLRHAVDALEVIAHRAARSARPGDGTFVGRLLDYCAMHGEEPQTVVRDEVLTALVAGPETIAAALTWCLATLAMTPKASRWLYEETSQLPDGDVSPSQRLPRCRAVIHETLRLYPPVWMIPREAAEEDTLDGYRIPAGAGVLVSPWVMHRKRDYWDDPEAFRPERFLSALEPEPCAFMPFGLGPRHCIGRHVATLQMIHVLARISARFNFAMVDTRALVPEALLTLRARGPINITVTQTTRSNQ